MQNEGNKINFGGCFVAGIAIFIIAIVSKQPIIAIIAVGIFILLIKKDMISFGSSDSDESTSRQIKVDQKVSQAFEDWMQKRNSDYKQKKKTRDNRPQQYPGQPVQREKDRPQINLMENSPRRPNQKQSEKKYRPRQTEKVDPLPELLEREDEIFVEELVREAESKYEKKYESSHAQEDWSILPGSTSNDSRRKTRISSPVTKSYREKRARKAAYVKNVRGRAPRCSACNRIVPSNASYCMHCDAGFREGSA